ncbi:MAG TPA: NUDIX domain-containing protein [Chitinophagaceae bacterium]|nr:NUDIX domain-containing protein [Chitinophagaceae bacterium]
MPRLSAGILLYRYRHRMVEVFLVHPGGPFWAIKDAGAWSIPKGEPGAGEAPEEAARREFREETGLQAPEHLQELATIRQGRGGKWVRAWYARHDVDADQVRSNLFSLEWPPKSGHISQFPEIDRAGWFLLADAEKKIIKGQVPLLHALEKILGSGQ